MWGAGNFYRAKTEWGPRKAKLVCIIGNGYECLYKIFCVYVKRYVITLRSNKQLLIGKLYVSTLL
jgi:hypothetical protein